jgi:hypothetical protein
MARKLLIVSPRFVPVESPEQQRARTLLLYLQENGWRGAVLTVADPSETRERDERLRSTVPAETEIVTTNCPSALPGFGSLGLRCFLSLKKAGEDWIRREKPDLVYLSTTEFDLFRLGPAWRKSLGVRYVLDYQDPWLTDYYSRPGAPQPPGGRWKYAFSQWRARRLEPVCVEQASGISCVSDRYVEELRARYPKAAKIPMEVIPFGVSQNDWALAEKVGRVPWEGKYSNADVWLNLGRLAPSMRTALEGFLQALAIRPPPAKTKILFLGTSYQKGAVSELDPVGMARRICPGVRVEAWPGRLPMLDAFRSLQWAGRLLFFGSDEPGYTPSRLFPYLMAGKPLLALLHDKSPAYRCMAGKGMPGLVGFREGQKTDSLAAQVAQAAWDKPVPPGTGVYSARQMSQELCDLFMRAFQNREAS